MRPTLLFAGAALALVAVEPASAGERYEIAFLGKKAALSVVDGKPCVVSPALEDAYWDHSRSHKAPVSFRLIEPQKWRGSYLAYDPKAKGKDKGRVFLADESGDGTKWVLTKLKGEDDDNYTIQAASGAAKGWYLDVQEEGKEFKYKDGKKGAAYPVSLSEKPKKVPNECQGMWGV